MLYFFKAPSDFSPAYLGSPYLPGRPSASWHGSLVARLGLDSSSDEAMLHGLLGAKLHFGLHSNQSAAAMHLTLTAPKGLSISALVGGDHRLALAHEQAVSSTMRYIERHLCCRVTEDHITSGVPVRHIAAAIFHRTTSKALDPSLHSHVALLNLADIGDGVLRALDLKVFAHSKIALGTIYRSELRNRVIELGYGVITAEDPTIWDLEAISPDLCSHFSSRRKQVVEVVERVTGRPISKVSAAGVQEFARATSRRRDPSHAPQTFAALLGRWSTTLGCLSLPPAPPPRPKPYVPGPLLARRALEARKQALPIVLDTHAQLCHKDMYGVAFDKLAAMSASASGLCIDVVEAAIADLAKRAQFRITEHPKIVYKLADTDKRPMAAPCPAEAIDHSGVADDSFVKVLMTPVEKRRAERYFLNRGFPNFGAFLSEHFSAPLAPPAAEDDIGASLQSGPGLARKAALRARVTPEVHRNLVAWSSGNLAGSLRKLMCAGRRDKNSLETAR